MLTEKFPTRNQSIQNEQALALPPEELLASHFDVAATKISHEADIGNHETSGGALLEPNILVS